MGRITNFVLGIDAEYGETRAQRILGGIVALGVSGIVLFYAGCIVFALIAALIGTPPIHPELGS